jgi:hypothetical protein
VFEEFPVTITLGFEESVSPKFVAAYKGLKAGNAGILPEAVPPVICPGASCPPREVPDIN